VTVPVYYWPGTAVPNMTFIFEVLDSKGVLQDHIYGLPELEYPGLVKARYVK
jgi:hypothetical protein